MAAILKEQVQDVTCSKQSFLRNQCSPTTAPGTTSAPQTFVKFSPQNQIYRNMFKSAKFTLIQLQVLPKVYQFPFRCFYLLLRNFFFKILKNMGIYNVSMCVTEGFRLRVEVKLCRELFIHGRLWYHMCSFQPAVGLTILSLYLMT